MEQQKQMTMNGFLEQPIKQPFTDVNKTVDKKKYIGSGVRVYIVRR